jgi:ketosteroid isomerase-like protein
MKASPTNYEREDDNGRHVTTKPGDERRNGTSGIDSAMVKSRARPDLTGIRADHAPDILMFDVPPPFLSRGLDAYMATWDTFFAWQAKPVEFDFHDVEINAGNDVAFATAIGRCCDLSSGRKVQLEFRLTMGFRKHNGRWRIIHEHHSLPATN